MNNSNSSFSTNNEVRNNADGMEVDQGSDADRAFAPTDSRREAARGESERAPPGPASSKARFRSRTRSGSVSSVSSQASSTSNALAAERKNRREIAHEVNRLAIAVASEQGGEQPPICIDSDESDGGSCSPERRTSSRKRKLKGGGEGAEAEGETGRKQRPLMTIPSNLPRTTGLYAGRAKAIAEWNKQKRETAALDNEKLIKGMSSGQIFSKLERDLEKAVSEMSDTPTADIASQARECMAGVLKVAKSSRNLQGGFVKILKHAAVVGSASAEVLRTRADSSGTDDDASRQVKALKRELEQIKREAQSAKEEAERAKQEAEKLRKELAETKGKRKTRRRVRTVIEDSPPSSPEQTKDDAVESDASTVEMEVDDPPAKTEVAKGEDPNPPKYCDIRRKEILPPPGGVAGGDPPCAKGEDKSPGGHSPNRAQD